MLVCPEKKLEEQDYSSSALWVNIDKRSHVERVLVVGSTDGRLNIYYDERL